MLEPTRNPLLLPEIICNVLSRLGPRELLQCACLNTTWNTLALPKLYEGTMYDMQFRTPDITSLNCLHVSSPERFARNLNFVKHLLIAPECPVRKQTFQAPSRIESLEYLRFLVRPDYAKRLLANCRGFKSLMIPFGIKAKHKATIYFELMLTESVEFLAIDDSYCRTLASVSFADPVNRFCGIRALTIYKSGTIFDVADMCAVINKCDLTVFHLEDSGEPEHMTIDHLTQVIQVLVNQKNLESLALVMPGLSDVFGAVVGKESPWPNLKVLQLGPRDKTVGEMNWTVRLPKLSKLESLFLAGINPLLSAVAHNAGLKDRLRSLHVTLFTFDDAKDIIDVLPGCKALQHLNLGELSVRPSILLSELFRHFPRLPGLECLVLDWSFHVDGIQQLATQCPLLKILKLTAAEFTISPDILRKMSPFCNLKTLKIYSLELDDPIELRRGEIFQQLVDEWRRVFPQIQHTPSVFMEVREEELEEHIREEERVGGFPPFSFENTRMLLGRMRNALGYRTCGDDSLEEILQCKLETEIVGWPVIPLWAYEFPQSYSFREGQ
ncbi:uncharacterized protein DSM5745_00315 [Aspergillus mulundensis]|uniref:F-box domain-containing protein n=1 Tax=Aspergillus mulundensis TaxID=1810919 RepID=A0A3D8T363_9EURO|nr:hypothetical protein DSM5745_00315 [Aspergillus mulundensis]RDW92993.1 hypothetical protein DSM5745_00315 [Aspergillus mulundensis]